MKRFATIVLSALLFAAPLAATAQTGGAATGTEQPAAKTHKKKHHHKKSHKKSHKKEAAPAPETK